MTMKFPGTFIFLHIPKTGGKWTRSVIKKNVHGATMIRKTTHGNVWARYGHADLLDVEEYPLFKFSFVRHPAEWWRSYFRYRMDRGWTQHVDIDRICGDTDDFNVFIDRVIELIPGYASDMFERYVGPPEKPIHFIGKQENLAQDLKKALGMAGLDTSKMRFEWAPSNRSISHSDCKLTPHQRSALELAESKAMHRFNY